MSIDLSFGIIPYFSIATTPQLETAETLEKEVVEALEAEAESLSTDRRKQFLAGMRQHAGDILKFLDLMEKEGAFPFKIMETARVLFAELKEIGVDFAKATEVNHQQFNREISAYELFRSFQVKLKKLVTEEEHSVSSFADLMERGRQANAEMNVRENMLLGKMTAGLVRAGGAVAMEAVRAAVCNLTPVNSMMCRAAVKVEEAAGHPVKKAMAEVVEIVESFLPKNQALAYELHSQFGIPLAEGKKYGENAFLVGTTLLPVPPVAKLVGRGLPLADKMRWGSAVKDRVVLAVKSLVKPVGQQSHPLSTLQELHDLEIYNRALNKAYLTEVNRIHWSMRAQIIEKERALMALPMSEIHSFPPGMPVDFKKFLELVEVKKITASGLGAEGRGEINARILHVTISSPEGKSVIYYLGKTPPGGTYAKVGRNYLVVTSHLDYLEGHRFILRSLLDDSKTQEYQRVFLLCKSDKATQPLPVIQAMEALPEKIIGKAESFPDLYGKRMTFFEIKMRPFLREDSGAVRLSLPTRKEASDTLKASFTQIQSKIKEIAKTSRLFEHEDSIFYLLFKCESDILPLVPDLTPFVSGLKHPNDLRALSKAFLGKQPVRISTIKKNNYGRICTLSFPDSSYYAFRGDYLEMVSAFLGMQKMRSLHLLYSEVPTIVVLGRDGEVCYSVMTDLGKTYAKLLHDPNAPTYFYNLGRALGELHGKNRGIINPGTPIHRALTAGGFRPVQTLQNRIELREIRVSENRFEKLEDKIVETMRETPLTTGFVHGEIHLNNITWNPKTQKVGLIDLDKVMDYVTLENQPMGLPIAEYFDVINDLMDRGLEAKIPRKTLDELAASFKKGYKSMYPVENPVLEKLLKKVIDLTYPAK